MVQPPRPAPAAEAAFAPPAAAEPPAPEPGHTRIFKPQPDTEAVSSDDADRLGLARTPAAVIVGDERHELTKRTVVLGRSRDCDITLNDPNVSRRHAEIRQEDAGYWIVDLGSTNGIEVNGRRVDRAKLTDADRIVLGKTDVTFERGF